MPELSIDAGRVTVLVMCECGWRRVATSRSRAWFDGARHLKEHHGDINAGARARNTARHALAREVPPDTSPA